MNAVFYSQRDLILQKFSLKSTFWAGINRHIKRVTFNQVAIFDPFLDLPGAMGCK